MSPPPFSVPSSISETPHGPHVPTVRSIHCRRQCCRIRQTRRIRGEPRYDATNFVSSSDPSKWAPAQPCVKYRRYRIDKFPGHPIYAPRLSYQHIHQEIHIRTEYESHQATTNSRECSGFRAHSPYCESFAEQPTWTSRMPPIRRSGSTLRKTVTIRLRQESTIPDQRHSPL